MIRFDYPWLLLLALPWLGFWWLFAGTQRRACDWIWSQVGARFQGSFTRLTPRGLPWQLGFALILGLLLILGAARPTLSGGAEVRQLSGRLVVLLDASASMYANDIVSDDRSASGSDDSEGASPSSRFELARSVIEALFDDALASDGASEIASFEVALVSFSGNAVLELPMTRDRAAIAQALRTVEAHTYYSNSGSSLAVALDRLFHFVDPQRQDLQAVLVGDGELPFEQSYDEPLEALAKQGIPVHAMTLGGIEGQTRLIFDFQDVIDKKEEKRVLLRYTTRREDQHFRRIADRTGGRFAAAATTSEASAGARQLAAALADRASKATRRVEDQRTDISPWLLGIILIAYWLESAILGRATRPADETGQFDLSALGTPRRRPRANGAAATPASTLTMGSMVLFAAIGFVSCQQNDKALQARQENRRGVRADTARLWSVARTHYDRSIGYGVQPQIPTYNLARSVTLQADYSEAHSLFQRALELEPELAEAHDNDGHALFRWGELEKDPRGCLLERTLELWQAAEKRFSSAVELYRSNDSAESVARRKRARDNLHFLTSRIAEIEALIRVPPDECRSSSSSSGGNDDEPSEDNQSSDGGAVDSQGAGASGDDSSQSEAEAPGSREDQGAGGEGEGEGERSETEAGGGAGSEPDQNQTENSESPSGSPSGQPQGREPQPLSAEEQEQIAAALDRIGAELLEEGKYYRRTRAEQFSRATWKNPDRVLWW